MFYYDYYSLVLLIPLFILSFIIQIVLKSTYSKYSRIANSRGTTGCEIAQRILANAGVNDVSIECVSGQLTDHYDPSKKTIRLSSDVFNGTSISAIGVAAHETGHALQYAAEYAPIRLRSAIIGITNFSSRILYVLIILSFAVSMPILSDLAVICFFIIFFFQFITLPVEFNASARAIDNIKTMGYGAGDLSGAKKVLSAAAMTYVAAMLISLAQLISFFLRTRRR